MSFQDVAFLPSQASLYITFLKNGGRGESLRTTTYHKTVVGGKQGHAPCKTLLLHKDFLMSIKVNRDHKTAYKEMVNSGQLQLMGYYRI